MIEATKPSKAAPQTSLRVLAQLVMSMIIFGTAQAMIGTSREDPFRIPQAVITGAIAATINIAFAYRRLPRHARLAPPSAMGLGLLDVVLLMWLAANRDPSVHRGAVGYILFALLMAAPLYLFVAGMLQWRGIRDSSGGS